LSVGRFPVKSHHRLMPEPSPDLRLEIAHVLFIDIVGYSRLLINEQREYLEELNQVVRGTEAFRDAETAGKLTRLPTGDGMALVFSTTPEAPVECALQVSRALKSRPDLPVRMGVHSGPVSGITDVNDRSNVAGGGINTAQRVMDCGDAGHILLSKRVAEDLAQYRNWQPCLHDLGECQVKHDVTVSVVNLYTEEVGNPAIPERLKREKQLGAIPPPSKSTRLWKPMVLASALLIVIALAAGFWLLSNRSEKKSTNTSASLGGERRIAVLPFKPLIAENRDQVLELGMADTLIAKLSNTRRVIVSSLNAVRKYGGLEQDSSVAGRELQVTSVLEGNVQKVGDRIRVTARLINVADGSSLWAGTFDEKFTDVFAVQDAISQKVADALALRLSGEERQRLTRRYTDNVEAYQLYLTGRYHLDKLIPPEIRTAIGFFQQAIEKDPNYALAYFGLAQANRSLAITSDVPSKDCLPQAKAAAKRALEIDESLAEAHASLSFILIWFDWDWPGAMREAERALALNPNSAFAHFAHGHVLSDLGRHDEAIAEIARARELEPVFLLIRALEGMFLLHAGRDDEALAKLQKALEVDPNFWITHLTLGKVYIQQRKYPEAIAEFAKARELSHGNSEAIASVGYVAALAGDKAKARAVLDELKNLSNQHYIPPVNIALVYNGLGDQNEALSNLEKACEERDVRLTLLKVDPRWDSFRSNPGFVAILKRIGLQ
jgi:TolB-like protein/tetratricopeptide (TPR) repeat protein/class 3 adenylate cyclase